jgi:hypothetical protein
LVFHKPKTDLVEKLCQQYGCHCPFYNRSFNCCPGLE